MTENLIEFKSEQDRPVLRDLMGDEQPNIVRIGTTGSGDFVYIGPASDLYGEKLWHINRDMKKVHDQKEIRGRMAHDREAELIRTGKKTAPKGGLPEFRKTEFVPLLDRKVISAYDGDVEKHRVYIVEGFEKLVDYNPPMSTDAKELNTERSIELIEGVYRNSLNNLAKAYRRLLRAKTIKEMMYAAEDVQKEEGWLKMDTWEILNGSAEGMIRTARQIVEKEICRAIVKRPDEKYGHMTNVSNSLPALQKHVGGYIETVTLWPDATIICNEEARLKDLPYNCTIEGVDFYGTIIVIGINDEDFTNLPEGFAWSDWKRMIEEGKDADKR